MLRKLTYGWLLSVIALPFIVSSCDDDTDEPAKPPVASFQFEKDANDFAKVTFTNFSQNAESFSWNFGDGSAASTEENPVHTFPAAGTYTVKLTVTGAGNLTAEKSEEIEITDPNAQLKKLTGETSKSWKLLREVSGGEFPMVVGNQARTEIYWSFGGATPLGERPCALDDEFTFSVDGTFTYDAKDEVFADAGQFGPWSDDIGSTCVDAIDENFVGKDGDISAWNSGTHEFEYDATNAKLTVKGLGAFIGLQKVATDAEVRLPQEEVTYNVVKLVDGTIDTLVVEALMGTANYWRFILVHYDNPADEPAMPAAEVSAGFTVAVDGSSVTFTNTSTNATSYSWDFGDGASSTDENPVHTYAANGSYTVKLTATNSGGSKEVSQLVTIGGAACTPDETESVDPAAGINLTLETGDNTSTFGGFGGVDGGRVDNPSVSGINESCFVNQYHKNVGGCETWGGAAVGLPTAIDFANDKKKFSIKVYAATETTDVVLRLEKLAFPDTEPSAERTATITATNEWQELTFDFSDITDPNTYKNLVIYFDRGACDTEEFFYFDDLKQID
jgi:PKD repeat protein